MTDGVRVPPEPDAGLREKLDALYEEGRRLSDGFREDARRHGWHPFFASDYRRVERALLPLRQSGLKFLEWGSGTGVITITASLLGLEAYGIELDPQLVTISRGLAARFDSTARFAAGSFLPDGYVWVSSTGDPRLGTLGEGESGYPGLGCRLEDFDVVFGYPWSGEEPIMHDLMEQRGGRNALLLVHDTHGVRSYVRGQEAGERQTRPA